MSEQENIKPEDDVEAHASKPPTKAANDGDDFELHASKPPTKAANDGDDFELHASKPPTKAANDEGIQDDSGDDDVELHRKSAKL